MKKLFYPLIFLAVFVAGGCNGEIDNDLNLLERRLRDVQSMCEKINNNINDLKSVVEVLQNNDFVTDVKEETVAGEKVLTIYFMNSDPIVIYHGTDAESPIIGVDTLARSDGKYYWTITYPGEEPMFIVANDGNMIAATAVSPRMRINEGQWEVSYDEGVTWTNQYNGKSFGAATGESPQSFFDSVIDSGDFIIFRMVDSSSIVIPSWSAFERIQETVRIANENYNATQTIIKALKEKLFINGISPIVSPAGDTAGYKLILSDGTDMAFYNGVPTNRPEVGVSRDPENPEDTAYYWTVRQVGDTSFTWALSSGEKVRADAGILVPQIAVSDEEGDGFYYWKISFDGGMNWSPVLDTAGNSVKASIKENATVIDSISVTENYVYIRQAGAEYRIERYQDFSVLMTALSEDGATDTLSSLTLEAGETKTFNVSVEAGASSDYSEYEVLPVAPDGFVAKVKERSPAGSSWSVAVTAPSDFSSDSRMSVIVSNGRGLMKTYTIEIVCKI